MSLQYVYTWACTHVYEFSLWRTGTHCYQVMLCSTRWHVVTIYHTTKLITFSRLQINHEMGLIQEVRTMSGNTFACERSKPIPVLIHQIFVEIKLNSITILFLAVCIDVFFPFAVGNKQQHLIFSHVENIPPAYWHPIFSVFCRLHWWWTDHYPMDTTEQSQHWKKIYIQLRKKMLYNLKMSSVGHGTSVFHQHYKIFWI